MAEKHNAVVTFDVPTGRQRRVLHRRLERYGHRVAYSVYELTADMPTLRTLVAECENVVGDGHLVALPQCSACLRISYGESREDVPEEVWTAW